MNLINKIVKINKSSQIIEHLLQLLLEIKKIFIIKLNFQQK